MNKEEFVDHFICTYLATHYGKEPAKDSVVKQAERAANDWWESCRVCSKAYNFLNWPNSK